MFPDCRFSPGQRRPQSRILPYLDINDSPIFEKYILLPPMTLEVGCWATKPEVFTHDGHVDPDGGRAQTDSP
jgi:hypothetical protein